MTNRTLKAAARLAAATALTGSLAACEGRLGSLFSASGSMPPSEMETAALQPPARPGNPVYIGGSRAANQAAYDQEYGAPLSGSGQTPVAQVKRGYAPSVYDDNSIRQAPLVTPEAIPAPVSDGGYSAIYGTPGIETGGLAVTPPAPPPVLEYSAPVTADFPAIGGAVYEPQSSASVPQPDLFSDASYQPMMSQPVSVVETAVIDTGAYSPIAPAPALPVAESRPAPEIQMAYVVEDSRPSGAFLFPDEPPYGSTASHRYSVPSLDAVPSVEIGYASISEQPLPEIEPMIEAAPVTQAAPVEVAFLNTSILPRSRPDDLGILQQAALTAPVPEARPQVVETVLTTPLPRKRPLGRVAMSGKAITDAPPLTEAPKMIEVEAVFDDTPVVDTSGPEMASLAPTVDIVKEADFSTLTETAEEPEARAVLEEAIEKADAPDPAPEPEPEPEEVAALPTRSDAVEDEAHEAAVSELSGTSWRLVTLGSKTVDADAELHFDGASGFAGGQAFCNNYGGEFSEKLDGTFDMGNIFTTETQCPHLSSEKSYISALEKATKYRVGEGMKTLTLLGEGGEPVATFTAF